MAGLMSSHSFSSMVQRSRQGEMLHWPKHQPSPPILQMWVFFQAIAVRDAEEQFRAAISTVYFRWMWKHEHIFVIIPSFFFPPMKYTLGGTQTQACEDNGSNNSPIFLIVPPSVSKMYTLGHLMVGFEQKHPPAIMNLSRKIWVMELNLFNVSDGNSYAVVIVSEVWGCLVLAFCAYGASQWTKSLELFTISINLLPSSIPSIGLGNTILFFPLSPQFA